MDLLRFSVPRLADDFRKMVFQNRNSSRRNKRLIKLSNRVGLRLILFSVITALMLSSLSLLPDSRLSPGAQVSAASEAINTFAPGCTTPDANFNFGETVCAVATDAVLPISGRRQRRIQWVTPDGVVVQQVDITSNPQSNSFAIPTSGPFAQVGTWTVKTVDNRGAGRATAQFIVRNPATVTTDVSVTKSGPHQASAGTNITYTVSVINRGPDDAQNVVMTDGMPANTTFVSETQISGPTASCTNPSAGSATGATVCTIGTLAAGASAVFSITYSINSGTAEETEITNTATVTSSTGELHAPDNTVTATTLVTAAAESCTITCPGDINQAADGGQCTAVVDYSPASGTGGNCNPIECSPPAGSTFPSGTTTVTCAAATGDPCNFTITVTGNDEQAPTIICPADVTTEAPPSSTTSVDYPEPETIDNCSAVTVNCSPASGSSFPIGTTAVTCTATDASNNSANCTFNVIVNESMVNCALSCSPDITKSVDPNSCSAVVSYAQPQTTGSSCGTVVCTPASGAAFPVGQTIVTCTAAEGATCSFSVTVVETVPPTITACATNKIIAADSECMAVMPDLTGEVVASDNCSTVTVFQTPPAEELIGVGDTVVTIRVIDDSGNETICTATVRVTESTPPVISCPANITTVDNAPGACGAILNPGTASATDNCGVASIVGTRSDNAALNALYPVGTTVITWRATDFSGNFSTCEQTVTVTNPNPAVTITGPASGSLFQINAQVPFRSTFTDNLGDTHTAQWTFDAINAPATVVEPTATTTGTANLNFAFTVPGVYLIQLNVIDDCGNVTIADTVNAQPALVVVFDPEGQFVTGGGWITPPQGSLVADPNRTGKGNFGFNAKYHNGETIPRGETQFRFGNFNFHSTSYEWLVIEGPKLQFKGSGKVNNSGDYGFLLTAIDGNESGGGGTDKFRLKIWDKNNNNAVVYDNQMNAPDTANPTTVLGGGNIVIHR
ncbi:MAG TPA: HYR domain-containing protein [Blastocatellia bacterium]|nr:HYR domain-containing protein [Blastocatellia bacterium]